MTRLARTAPPHAALGVALACGRGRGGPGPAVLGGGAAAAAPLPAPPVVGPADVGRGPQGRRARLVAGHGRHVVRRAGRHGRGVVRRRRRSSSRPSPRRLTLPTSLPHASYVWRVAGRRRRRARAAGRRRAPSPAAGGPLRSRSPRRRARRPGRRASRRSAGRPCRPPPSTSCRSAPARTSTRRFAPRPASAPSPASPRAPPSRRSTARRSTGHDGAGDCSFALLGDRRAAALARARPRPRRRRRRAGRHHPGRRRGHQLPAARGPRRARHRRLPGSARAGRSRAPPSAAPGPAPPATAQPVAQRRALAQRRPVREPDAPRRRPRGSLRARAHGREGRLVGRPRASRTPGRSRRRRRGSRDLPAPQRPTASPDALPGRPVPRLPDRLLAAGARRPVVPRDRRAGRGRTPTSRRSSETPGAAVDADGGLARQHRRRGLPRRRAGLHDPADRRRPGARAATTPSAPLVLRKSSPAPGGDRPASDAPVGGGEVVLCWPASPRRWPRRPGHPRRRRRTPTASRSPGRTTPTSRRRAWSRRPVVDTTSHVSPKLRYPDGAYLWRVQALDASGHRLPWSAAQAFTRDGTAPTWSVVSAATAGAPARRSPCASPSRSSGPTPAASRCPASPRR